MMNRACVSFLGTARMDGTYIGEGALHEAHDVASTWSLAKFPSSAHSTSAKILPTASARDSRISIPSVAALPPNPFSWLPW
jgi:hypothetical protein